MINYLKFKNKIEDEIYTEREYLFSRISNLEDLYNEYITIEPHCFLHAGAISNTINQKKLNGSKAISIGIDALKDSILVKKNNLSIDVFDIDENSVALGNKFSHDIQISKYLKYFKQDILSKDFTIKKNYDLLILSQMDYILNDEEIELLVKKISLSKIKYILIITPSIFSFSPYPYKIIDLIFNLLRSCKSYFKPNSKKYYTSYRRRKSYFLDLFREHYIVDHSFDYAYPSGREYLFLLKSRNLL